MMDVSQLDRVGAETDQLQVVLILPSSVTQKRRVASGGGGEHRRWIAIVVTAGIAGIAASQHRRWLPWQQWKSEKG